MTSQKAALKKAGVEYAINPRQAGSWPGVTFTGPPLKLPAVGFGLGTGGGAHAPDEWYLIDSKSPKVAGLDEFGDILCRLSVRAGGHGEIRAEIADALHCPRFVHRLHCTSFRTYWRVRPWRARWTLSIISDARQNLKEIMDRVVANVTEVVITRQRADPVVMVSLAEWNSINVDAAPAVFAEERRAPAVCHTPA